MGETSKNMNRDGESRRILLSSFSVPRSQSDCRRRRRRSGRMVGKPHLGGRIYLSPFTTYACDSSWEYR